MYYDTVGFDITNVDVRFQNYNRDNYFDVNYYCDQFAQGAT